MTIQWFPGHMAKAKREVEEKLHLVDFIMELVDARAPYSSRNPMLNEVIKDKPKLVLLMKKDLADPKETDKWLHHLRSSRNKAMAVDVDDSGDLKRIIEQSEAITRDKQDALQQKGIQKRTDRVMIIGIPNVGKSSLINRLAGRKIAKTGDRPAMTKSQSWIKVGNQLELLDTPGILWPKFDDEKTGYRLAAIGTIKDDILIKEDISAYVLAYFQEHYPEVLRERYDVEEGTGDMWDVFVAIGKRFGALESGGHINFDKVADIVLNDLRKGKLGAVTLETPSNQQQP